MNLQTLTADIKKLEAALTLIEKTENYMHFNKSKIMLDICEEISNLKDKHDKQVNFLKSLNN